jgi:hypothetical protein
MFTELIAGCTDFALATLKEANDQTIAELQTSGATRLLEPLQMLQLQKAIMAVGMFSLFESILQDALKWNAETPRLELR